MRESIWRSIIPFDSLIAPHIRGYQRGSEAGLRGSRAPTSAFAVVLSILPSGLKDFRKFM